MTQRDRRARGQMLVVMAVCAAGLPALNGWASLAEDEAAVAGRLIAQVEAEERKVAGNRLTLKVTEYRGAYKPDESAADTAKRLESDPLARPLQAQGSFHFSSAGWLKDLTVPTAQPARAPTRSRTAEAGGIFRMLIEAPVGAEVRRIGRLAKMGTTAPADALLARRTARTLDGILWSTARQDGDEMRIVGFRTGERHALWLVTEPTPQVRRWELTRTLTAPNGVRVEQAYVCTLDRPATGNARLQEWVTNPPPTGTVAYRVTEVSGDGPPATAEDLRIVFPRGTAVSDMRSGEPVEYELTEDGTTDEDLAQATAALTRGRARVGQPAPDFDLLDPKGKSVRLADFKDKVLVLVWFSSASARGAEIGQAVRELSDAYRKKGASFLGLSIAERGDARLDADAYRKKMKWNFPIALDGESEAMRRYGWELGVPKVAVVDRTGKLVYVRPGFDPDGVRRVLDGIMSADQ